MILASGLVRGHLDASRTLIILRAEMYFTYQSCTGTYWRRVRMIYNGWRTVSILRCSSDIYSLHVLGYPCWHLLKRTPIPHVGILVHPIKTQPPVNHAADTPQVVFE